MTTLAAPVSPLGGSAATSEPDSAKAADRADLAVRCTRLAIGHITAYGNTHDTQAINTLLRDAAAFLDALHHLLTDQAHHEQPPAEGSCTPMVGAIGHARRYVWTALLFTDHLFASPSAQPATTADGPSPHRCAAAHVLTALATERLYHSLTRITALRPDGGLGAKPR